MKNAIALLALVLLAACTTQPANQEAAQRTQIVCTTSIVADAIKNLVPPHVEVTSLMGPGVDPHLYKATQGDLERLQSADIIFYNGLHLEGKMGDVLAKLGRLKPVFALAQNVGHKNLIQLQDNPDAHDPHIWFDLSLWALAVKDARDYLLKQKPEWAAQINAGYKEYVQDLTAAHNQAKTTLSMLPPEHRVLVTAHDAFSYFGRAYGMQVMGLQGISTASEYGLNDVSMLVRTISEQRIPAVFVESSVPKRSIQAVVEGCQKKGHNVKLGGQLYSDALGEKGSGAETLIGAFNANVKTIANGLKNTNP